MPPATPPPSRATQAASLDDLGLTLATLDRAADARRHRDWSQLLDDLATTSRDSLALLDALEEGHGEQPSACPGWSVADVVAHLALGDQDAIRVLRHETWGSDVDDPDAEIDRRVKNFRMQIGPSVSAATNAWRAARGQLLQALGELDPDDRFERVDWAVQPITRIALAQSRVMETWIHTWDVAAPLGHPHVLDDRVWWVADLGVRSLPYAIAHESLEPDVSVTLDLVGPAGGHWNREIGAATETVTVEGPGWAWVVLCSRRVGLDRVRPHLTISGAASTVEQIETARAFL